MRKLGAVLLLLGAAAGGPYGFRGLEIYKLDHNVRHPLPCDADGDGLTDLLIANNDRARIEVFLRRKEKVPPKKRAAQRLPNDLLDDQYFERREILTEKQVWSMATGDFNGDGHVDVAHYGKPESLVVAYGDGKGDFPDDRTFPESDGAPTTLGLAAGDLNGDGRTDLAFLAKTYTAIYYQTDQGTLAEPVKLPHTEKELNGVLVRDLDGDGRADLLLLHPSSSRGLRVRFQRADGSLGAEVMFLTSPWRSFELHDLDPAPGTEVVVVQRASGVLRALTMKRKEQADLLGEFQVYPFEEARGGKARSMAIGDVDGDGRTDVVVTEPGSAQVALYRGDPRGGLLGVRLFPSLSNTEAVRAADLDGDGRAEVVVFSSAEKAVGVASWSEGRLPFPRLLDLDGTPRALDLGDVDGDGRADLAVVVEPEKKSWNLLLVPQAEEGGLAAEPSAVIPLEGLKQAPEGLMILDVDQDGRNDLLLFDRYEAVRVLRAGEGGYEDLSKRGTSYRGGLVHGLERGNVSASDLDGDGKPELLAATKNFARAIVCSPEGALTVKDQANAASPRAQVQGAAALDLDGDGEAEIALYDKEGKQVTVLRRREGVFTVVANVPVGDLDYQALAVSDLNGDRLPDLVLFGKDRLGVLYARGEERELVELHKVESSIRDASLGEFAIGDLDGDGKADVAVLDSNRAIQIFSYDPQQGFREEIRWEVYERKLHDERREGGAHSLVIADFDADGENDLALVAHDRLIVYPQ